MDSTGKRPAVRRALHGDLVQRRVQVEQRRGVDTVTCSLNAALLRPAATDLAVTDVRGNVVMRADLS